MLLAISAKRFLILFMDFMQVCKGLLNTGKGQHALTTLILTQFSNYSGCKNRRDGLFATLMNELWVPAQVVGHERWI